MDELTKTYRVTLVDDSPEDTFLFQHASKNARDDIQVSTWLEPRALLQHLSAINAENLEQLPDLLFVDINMPDMNGIDLLLALKANARLRHIPVLMFSTSASRNDIDKCYSSGAAGYLVKPSGNKELVVKLSQVFSYWTDSVEPTQIA